jgi:undecaprenyl-diphosphatase
MAVVILFWKKIFPLTIAAKKIIIKKDILLLWLKILVACLPAALIGLLFDEFFERLFYNSISVANALIIFGIAFIIVEKHNKNLVPKTNSLAEITYRLAMIIGIFQLIAAIFPGTSRSGATILGALLFGVSRTVAAEFTFVLAIPVMFGASLLKLWRFGFSFTSMEAALLFCGMLSAFLVSIFVIRFLLGFVKKHDFKVFGYYRIVLGAIVLLQFFFTSFL